MPIAVAIGFLRACTPAVTRVVVRAVGACATGAPSVARWTDAPARPVGQDVNTMRPPVTFAAATVLAAHP